MTKTIDTGTKITFKETGDKFILTKTQYGFDLKKIMLSKDIKPELWSFHELGILIEKGEISIDGFEETDTSLALSIMTNYMHDSVINSMKVEMEKLNVENQRLIQEHEKLIAENQELSTSNKELNTALEAMKE